MPQGGLLSLDPADLPGRGSLPWGELAQGRGFTVIPASPHYGANGAPPRCGIDIRKESSREVSSATATATATATERRC